MTNTRIDVKLPGFLRRLQWTDRLAFGFFVFVVAASIAAHVVDLYHERTRWWMHVGSIIWAGNALAWAWVARRAMHRTSREVRLAIDSTLAFVHGLVVGYQHHHARTPEQEAVLADLAGEIEALAADSPRHREEP